MTAKPFVFSIRPVYLDMFRAGTKRRTPPDFAAGWQVEFRTRRPSVKTGERHLIYETAPVSMVAAVATIGDIIDGTPDYVWAQTVGPGGISREAFEFYFAADCETCGGSGIDPHRPPQPVDFGCDPCEGSGFIGLRPRAVAIEMTMAWLEVPLALSQSPPQSWSRWKGPWPLPGMTSGVGG